jgi:hypothetical protein
LTGSNDPESGVEKIVDPPEAPVYRKYCAIDQKIDLGLKINTEFYPSNQGEKPVILLEIDVNPQNNIGLVRIWSLEC